MVYPASENLLMLPRFFLSPGTLIASLALLRSSGIGNCTLVVALLSLSSHLGDRWWCLFLRSLVSSPLLIRNVMFLLNRLLTLMLFVLLSQISVFLLIYFLVCFSFWLFFFIHFMLVFFSSSYSKVQ